MRLAQRLPVVLRVPEQNQIATMRNDVIDASGRRESAGALTLDAQWMLSQVDRSCSLPCERLVESVPCWSAGFGALPQLPACYWAALP